MPHIVKSMQKLTWSYVIGHYDHVAFNYPLQLGAPPQLEPPLLWGVVRLNDGIEGGWADKRVVGR